MKALVYNTLFDNRIALIDRDMPKIVSNTDAIVKVTMSSICTSDLHIMHGLVPRAKNNLTLGHEFVGEVVAVGKDVKQIRKGDRVAANCITFCGECYFCKRGFINNCQNGGWELGCRIDGCQAEYVRVPFADMGLTRIPISVTNEAALFVGDVLSSGYFGAEMCEIKQGDTVAVIGAGPVGLCAMMCANYMGASNVIAIDINNERLKIAQEQGLSNCTLNPNEVDIEDIIKKLTNNIGVDSVIEAAGTKETFEMAWKIARPNAIVGIVAMYDRNMVLPLPDMYGKNLTFKTGGVDAIHCKKLLDLIDEKEISTGFLITHKFPLKEIETAYKLFQSKPNNCLKIAITH
ncbi:MAG: alcohol dehydrogenase catalytic domain-containing protein [Candidatus Gastranaerophilales bacterium]|nr:alcohol dehydrogenase catalytic domain-containing protein [Candidatus Gastranaerophilales bacterium]